MKQIFSPKDNTLARVSILGFILFIIGLGCLTFWLVRSSFYTKVGVAVEQPVPFSHKHHVEGLGMDCRFCHTSVEKSSFAGIPPTATCMKCHNVIWKESPALEPVRESWRTGKPLNWWRVHDLPDHVYFNHSIHVAKGVSCLECHGQVNEMPLMHKKNTLHMEWCLGCHRHPETRLSPKEELFNMHWKKPEGIQAVQQSLLKKNKVSTVQNCSACHR